jgi:hypothetical protein
VFSHVLTGERERLPGPKGKGGDPPSRLKHSAILQPDHEYACTNNTIQFPSWIHTLPTPTSSHMTFLLGLLGKKERRREREYIYIDIVLSLSIYIHTNYI